MKKSSFRENLNEIHKIASIMPKTLNEAIHFEDESMLPEEDALPDEEEMPTPEMEQPEMPEPEVDDPGIETSEEMPEEDPLIDLDKGPGRELVDKIRKISLNGLAQMAETPELPEYEVLKKIWQLCDKSLAERKEKEGEDK